MILLFSRSFRFWRKSSGLATVFWSLLLPSKMDFIYTSSFPAASLSYQFSVSMFLIGHTHKYLFHLLILSAQEAPHWWQMPAELGRQQHQVSHWRSCGAESFHAQDSHRDNGVTNFGFSHHSTWVLPVWGCLLLTTPVMALLARCCTAALQYQWTAGLNKQYWFSNDSLCSFLITLY